MPYIKQEYRKILESTDLGRRCECAGDLNYTFCRIASGYISQKGKSYQNLHDVIGALQDAADEIKRRVLGPYEDKAIENNGDAIEEML